MTQPGPPHPPHQPHPPAGYGAQPPTAGYPAQPGGPAYPAQAAGPGYPSQPAWPGYPPQAPGYPPAPPAAVVKRIPEDQPFLVRPSIAKRCIQFGGLGLVLLVLLGCPLGLAISDGGGTGALVVGLVLLVVLFGGLFGLQIYLLTSGGPSLGVNPAGVWVKTRPTRGQAVFLPWQAIERVYRRRWGIDKVICVKPRDPRSADNLGTFTAIDSSMQQLLFGTGFTAPLTFGDRPEQEVMAAIAHFAAGRVRIE